MKRVFLSRGKKARKCDKRRFHNEGHAKEALLAARFSRERAKSSEMESSRHEIRYYLCNICNGYHLTSQEFFENENIGKES
jgi:hypothetical protein